jgi:hypothetical protein
MQKQPSTGLALKVAGIALIALGALLYAVLGGPDDNPAAFLGVFVMIAGIIVHFRGRQHAARARAQGPQSPLSDSKPDVLYLRSFRTDPSSKLKKLKVLQSGLSTEEEQLADVLRPFGDLIAIGQPGEPLPIPGATRMYASDSEWKALVLDRMRVAPLVVIRAGTGAGLLWEFGQGVEVLKPERVLVLVLDIAVREYAEFTDQVRKSFGLRLPALEPFGLLNALTDYRKNPSKVQPGFIRFSSGWISEFLPMPSTIITAGYNDLKKSFNLALRPVFEENGVTWRPVGRFGNYT